jgi:prepilin-type N-terminal cleavage/methylation domain-containing protein
MNRSAVNNQAGFSLIEVVIVLGMVVVIAAFALIGFRTSKVVIQRQTIARELKTQLERARFDAVKRRATADNPSTVVITTPTSFVTSVDLNQNGVIDPAEVQTTDFHNQSDVTISILDAFVYPVTIAFDYRGRATGTDGAGGRVTPVFTICSNNCAPTTISTNDITVISISPRGTVAMLSGGEAVPTFNAPTVTQVNSSSGINPMVYIASNSNSANAH